ncbi:MAG TPA: WXG100 family type VII secretion target [Rugosimonospora sp.]|nr:WXG100 family type VII secretion target [Rugosimonospora sp.]
MTTQAQAAVMDSTAARFEHVNEELQGMLKRLLGELEVLQTQWVGRGGTTFEQVKQAWAADQQTLQRALGETATAIRTSGRQYQTSDGAAADRLGAHRGGLALPL